MTKMSVSSPFASPSLAVRWSHTSTRATPGTLWATSTMRVARSGSLNPTHTSMPKSLIKVSSVLSSELPMLMTVINITPPMIRVSIVKTSRSLRRKLFRRLRATGRGNCRTRPMT
jgi:hypothetical protein